MASTNFQDYNQNTPIVASWLNDVNKTVYSVGGIAKPASLIADAWVRFSVTGGVVTIQQSVNIVSVTRISAGVFVIVYLNQLTNATNCYSVIQNTAGFAAYSNESTTSVQITLSNTGNVAVDPGSCCFSVIGAS